jgi:hypothetical protein
MKRIHFGIMFGFVCAGVTAGAACTFPTVIVMENGSGGASSSSSTGAGGHTTSTASSSSSSSTGTATSTSSSSTSTSTSSSSTSTSTASSTSSSTTSTSSSTSSSSGKCTTDLDGDGFVSWTCDPTKDCADHDPLAHPEPGVDYQAAAISGVTKPGTLPFDFNCNGIEEAETPTLNCSVCGSNTVGFKMDVACGQTGALGTCVGATVLCSWQPMSPAQMAVQKCK